MAGRVVSGRYLPLQYRNEKTEQNTLLVGICDPLSCPDVGGHVVKVSHAESFAAIYHRWLCGWGARGAGGVS